MHSVVCVKQVPDTTEVRIDPRTNTMVREGVPAIINPDDLHAIEAAVRLKEQFGGWVTVLTMGPPQAVKSLRRALSLGADAAVLVSDRAFAAADTYATTYVLALAIGRLQRERGVDLLFCGKQALDGDTGQVGPGLARRLNFPLLSYVTDLIKVDPAAGEIVVERQLGEGRERLQSRLPVLITVERVLNQVRYAALPDMLRAQEARVITWSAADLGADPNSVGLRGSPTKVARSFTPPPRGQVRMIPGAAEEPRQAAAMLADALLERKAIGGGDTSGETGMSADRRAVGEQARAGDEAAGVGAKTDGASPESGAEADAGVPAGADAGVSAGVRAPVEVG